MAHEVTLSSTRVDTRSLVRRAVVEMDEYTPVTSLEHLSEHLGVPIDRLTKLDGNENPYGCHPAVRAAIGAYEHLHIYPDPEQTDMRRALAKYVGVSPDYIIGGAGGDELIDLLARLVIDSGDSIIDCIPTFAMYAFSTQLCGGQVIGVPRLADFAIDVPGILRALTPRTKAIFVTSPNNPTANTTTEADVQRLLETGVLVIVDEAYFEFSGETVAPLVADHENLVVLRTFSKWAGLAGVRVGYALCHPTIGRHIWKMKPPYNVSVAAQIAVCTALEHLPELWVNVRRIIEERPRLYAALERIDFLRPIPSQANFIYCWVQGRSAREIRDDLRRRGILIRYFDRPHLRNAVRISVGKPEDTATLVEALGTL